MDETKESINIVQEETIPITFNGKSETEVEGFIEETECTSIVKHATQCKNNKHLDEGTSVSSRSCPSLSSFPRQDNRQVTNQMHANINPGLSTIALRKCNGYNYEGTNPEPKLDNDLSRRRSMTRTSPKMGNEQNKYIRSKLAAQNDNDLGLMVVVFPNKGRGLITKKALKEREFVLEYVGEIIDAETAKDREIKYSRNHTRRSYM